MDYTDIVFGSLAAISGYLAGAISFTRVVARIHPAHPDVNSTEVPIKAYGKDINVAMHAVSPTSLRYKVGPRWGILATLLDMLKAALPVLVWKLAFPEQPYVFIAAIAISLGHNWPVYYSFKGGYGTSVYYGSLLIIDWRSLLFTIGVSLVFSGILGKYRFGNITPDILGKIALILWAIFYLRGPWFILYACLVLVFYLIRLFPDARNFIRAALALRAERRSAVK